MPERTSLRANTPDLIDQFCQRHDYHQIGESRRRQQPKVLRRFEASLDGEFVDATHLDLQDYVESRVADGAAPNTVLKELKMIRPVFTWMWNREMIDGERLMRVRAVKPPRGTTPMGRPRPYNTEQLRRVRAGIDARYPWMDPRWAKADVEATARAEFFLTRVRRGTSRWSRVEAYAKRIQLEAIVALALHGALRLEEVYRLAVADCHPDNDYVVVTGAAKNPDGSHKQRPVPWMTEHMRDAVDRHLAMRAELAPPHTSPWLSLHQHHRAKPMPEDTFRGLLTGIASFHRLRHTAITTMMRSMPDKPHIVKEIAGHARLSQTLAYTEFLPTDVVAAARRSQSEFTRRIAA